MMNIGIFNFLDLDFSEATFSCLLFSFFIFDDIDGADAVLRTTLGTLVLHGVLGISPAVTLE